MPPPRKYPEDDDIGASAATPDYAWRLRDRPYLPLLPSKPMPLILYSMPTGMTMVHLSTRRRVIPTPTLLALLELHTSASFSANHYLLPATQERPKTSSFKQNIDTIMKKSRVSS